MEGSVHIGTSGWSYNEWRDGLYAEIPRHQWLAAYADHFDTVEINASFYRLQRESTLQKWFDETPEDFAFSAKGHRYVTHIKRLSDANETIPRSRKNMKPLAGKLHALLWQLPATLTRDLDELQRFVAILRDEWNEAGHAIEFRHPSWFDGSVRRVLDDHGIANCQSDSPDWPMWEVETGALRYVRLHGHSRLYASRYSSGLLEDWAKKISKWRRHDLPTYVYFDNTAEGNAPDDALRLLKILDSSRADEENT